MTAGEQQRTDQGQAALADALQISFRVLRAVMLLLLVFYLASGVFVARGQGPQSADSREDEATATAQDLRAEAKRCDALFVEGKHEEAIAEAKKLVDLNPSWGHGQLMLYYMALDRYTEAAAESASLLELEGNDPNTHAIDRHILLLEMDSGEERARKWLEEFCGRFPKFTDKLRRLEEQADQGGRYYPAAYYENFSETVRSEIERRGTTSGSPLTVPVVPPSGAGGGEAAPSALKADSISRETSGPPQEGSIVREEQIQGLGAVGEVPPSKPDETAKAEASGLMRDAQALNREGKHHEALVYAEKAVALDPLDERSLLELRNTYASLGRYSDAIKVCEQTIQIPNPAGRSNPYLTDMLHICLLELAGRQDEAIKRLAAACAEAAPDADTGPPFFLPVRKMLADLESAQAEGLYSKYAVAFKLLLECDVMAPTDAVKLLEKHLPVFPEAEHYIEMLKSGASVSETANQIHFGK